MPGDSDTHFYGSADEDNRQTPTANGMRGEATAPLAGAPPEQFRTQVVEGRTIQVEEESGVAAAEATGNINTAAQGDEEETAGSG